MSPPCLSGTQNYTVSPKPWHSIYYCILNLESVRIILRTATTCYGDAWSKRRFFHWFFWTMNPQTHEHIWDYHQSFLKIWWLFIQGCFNATKRITRRKSFWLTHCHKQDKKFSDSMAAQTRQKSFSSVTIVSTRQKFTGSISSSEQNMAFKVAQKPQKIVWGSLLLLFSVILSIPLWFFYFMSNCSQ